MNKHLQWLWIWQYTCSNLLDPKSFSLIFHWKRISVSWHCNSIVYINSIIYSLYQNIETFNTWIQQYAWIIPSVTCWNMFVNFGDNGIFYKIDKAIFFSCRTVFFKNFFFYKLFWNILPLIFYNFLFKRPKVTVAYFILENIAYIGNKLS